jgi:hypothetical protein
VQAVLVDDGQGKEHMQDQELIDLVTSAHPACPALFFVVVYGWLLGIQRERCDAACCCQGLHDRLCHPMQT